MAKIEAPYKNTFSLNHSIISHACAISYNLGKLSYSKEAELGDNEFATMTRFLLKSEGIELTPSQIRGLKRGEEIPAIPQAFRLQKLYGKLSKLALDPKLLEEFEAAAFPEGTPNRMSRSIPNFEYPLPPSSKVPSLMKGLFSFAKKSQAKVHPLVLACMVYYEVISIAPYSSFNNALAKLWLKALLSLHYPVLLGLPLERLLEARKEALNAAYEESANIKDGVCFLAELMQIIDEGVELLIKKSLHRPETPSPRAEKMVSLMEEGRFYSAKELLSLLGLKSRLGLQNNYIKPALERGLIVMSNPLCPTDRTQAYKKNHDIH